MITDTYTYTHTHADGHAHRNTALPYGGGATKRTAVESYRVHYAYALRWKRRPLQPQCQVHAGEEDHAQPGWTASRRGQDSPRGRVNRNDRGQR